MSTWVLTLSVVMCFTVQRSLDPAQKEVESGVMPCRRRRNSICASVLVMLFKLVWFLLFFSNMQRLLDQRQNLKFLVAEGLTPAQCWTRLFNVYGEEAMSKPTVRRWHSRFREGDGLTPVTDQICSGRPCSQTTPEKIQAAQAAVEEDRRATLKTIAQKVDVSVTTAHRLVKRKLELKQKVAKFVPRILSDEQKMMRVHICEQNLARLKADPNLLDKLMCGDESPVYLLDPETQRESKQWLLKEGQRPTKALRGRARRKMMLTVFFDARGMVLREFNDGIVDTDTYIQTLKNLRECIRKKRPFMWKGGVDGETNREFVIQQDNASCHTSNRTLAFLFDQDLLAHPPYSPDLAPCDFFLFPYLKKQLRGHRHQNLRDLKTAVSRVLRGISEEQCQEALVKLPLRWRKCVQAAGEYFEGCGLEVPFDPYFDLGPDHDANDEETDSD